MDFVIVETIRRSVSVQADSGTNARLARERGEGSILSEQVIGRLVEPNQQVNEFTPVTGVGTELEKLLSKLGLKPSANCKCNQHIAEMNAKGIVWCEQNIDTIVGWLKEEADRAKLTFTNIGARVIVKRAIHNAKKVDLNKSKGQEK